ncbi:Receptor-type tyrosine-protein phosphatase N2-like protein [Dinothrombium tinctorium]|uniref:Receptor-type tyrosine-protein phosphatase N2-like protein n=1 Tax=Dinothrombium tinctorium TaxID=1965070 RepID=A0A3S3PKB3_9ACAR|nr:Receptor-type tyrosine-protein phosphatase N2-like protein [Dinothrombium tinctorium]RWS16580.1 Receptor-type tyrosine-protein phosphatase N2-like protein [Dinothrombium tinctorium]RWS16588.1 Receptor-type tyrosine-protein phosphatase N2-like protein [Dinothrombium tinctorium]
MLATRLIAIVLAVFSSVHGDSNVDNAFGRCAYANSDDKEYRVHLSPKVLQLLESEMKRLYEFGYRWDHEYTQCVVRQILYTFHEGMDYDPGLCARLLRLTLPHVVSVILFLLFFSPSFLFLASLLTVFAEFDFVSIIIKPPEIALSLKTDSLASIAFDGDTNFGKEYFSPSDIISRSKQDEMQLTDEDEYQSDGGDFNDRDMDDENGNLNDWNEDNEDEGRDDERLSRFTEKRYDTKKPGPQFMTTKNEVAKGQILTTNPLQPKRNYFPQVKRTEGQVNASSNIETVDATHAFVILNKGVENTQVTFKVNKNPLGLNASTVAVKIEELPAHDLGRRVEAAGIGDKIKLPIETQRDYRTITVAFAAAILAAITVALGIYAYKRRSLLIKADDDCEKVANDYQDLCRQRMQNKQNEKKENLMKKDSDESMRIDIATGHMVLEFMEEYLQKTDRLDKEWETLCLYEPEGETNVANLPQNRDKNRFPEIVPFDNSRVILDDLQNQWGSDYINANIIYDSDPRNGVYIATQGPMKQTAADFWQMVWEQNVYIIVILTRLMENGVEMCYKYWPDEGSSIYHNHEVHLVSEHIWSDDYLVRSFYLKNIKTNVNKSYRGRSSPILIHCSDGVGRTGTYCLLDMVLNRIMTKGAKQIDFEATLEHIRDQRGGAVTSRQQFEFALKCVADEVYSILENDK